MIIEMNTIMQIKISIVVKTKYRNWNKYNVYYKDDYES